MENSDKQCGFCHRGTDVSDICGHMYTTESVTAHKRCMQYSAGLVQYHSNIGFGGFKREKVAGEITRGSKLKCALCSKVKKKSTAVVQTRGATSGCAWPRCAKSFHYYCAARDRETITRRMEVVDKSKKSHKFVEYRVFCSKKHQDAYISSKDKENQRVRKAQEESGSSGEELDRTAPPITAPDMDEDFETDSSSSSEGENTVSSTVKTLPSASKDRKRSKRSANNDSEDSDSNGKKAKIAKKESQKESKKKLLQETGSSSADDSSSGMGRAIGTLTQMEENDSKQEATENKKKNTGHNGTSNGGSSKDAEANPLKIDLNPKSDCLLCFVEIEEVAPDLEKKLKRFINKVYKIPSTSVCLWRRPDIPLSAEHTVYMLKDLTMALRHEQYTEFQRLILRLQADDVSKYNYIIELNSTYPDDLSKTLYSKLRDSIKENLTVASDNLKRMAGWYCRVQHKQEQIRVAFLTLSDGTDPERRIRKSILKQVDMHEWDAMTTVPAYNPDITPESRDQEYNILKQWLSVMDGAFVDARPWDPVMVGDQRGSVTVRLLRHIQTSTTYTDTSTRLIFLRPLDGNFIVYSSYVHKMLGTLFQDEAEQNVVVVCDLQPDLDTEDRILRGLPRNVAGKVLTAFSPQTNAVSCIVLKLHRAIITDDTVSSSTMVNTATNSDKDVEESTQNKTDISTMSDHDSDDGIDMCEIIREDPPTESINFTPPDLKWRLLQCNGLGLKMTSICSPNTILETRTIGIPSLTHKIKGDGNCFFRALSQEITGTQTQHSQVRKKLILYMCKKPQLFNKFFNMRDVKLYLDESEMGEDSTWATDTEIIAMATMLETNIVIFTKVGSCYKWLPYSPVTGVTSHNCQVYLVNKGHHYDLVLDVRANKN